MSNSNINLAKSSKTAKFAIVFCLGTIFIALTAWASSSIFGGFPVKVADESTITEGPISKAVITVGPFDLHRRYLSMEGPWADGFYSAGDLLNSKNIEIPEGMVNFLEKGDGAASMNGTAQSTKAGQLSSSPIGLVHIQNQSRELYWFKGVKLEVLDENGVVQPTAEFICHWNLDVDPRFRNQVFSQGHRTANTRLSSISQGETLQILPPGYGVPIASDEKLRLSFQAANRTTDVHRRIKHRCTLYFVKDKDLYYPIKALYFYVPYITVVTDKNSPAMTEFQKRACPVCIGPSEGVDAPNDKGGTFRDGGDRVLSGHWVIPPGVHTYCDLITSPRDTGFQVGNPVIRAAWAHVHPLCSKMSLLECVQNNRTPILTSHCETKTNPGLQIMHIDFLIPKGGVQLHESSQYELEVTYNNPLPHAVDSMASMGIYMEDPNFVRPNWAMHDFIPEVDIANKSTGALKDREALMSCAITNKNCTANKTDSESSVASTTIDTTPPEILTLPLFDKKRDGPLLDKVKFVRIETNAGPITVQLDPQLAPMTATYIYRLLSSGAFNGTKLFRYEPGFILQADSPTSKAINQPQMSPKLKALVRRVQLEVAKQKDHLVNHKKYMLSLAHYDGNLNSGAGSFSMLLGDAPHLDHKYTIFGKIDNDASTLRTLSKIETNWDPQKYWITGAEVMQAK